MDDSRLGGHVVVEQLLELGADLAFGVPGESYLAVLDGLYDVSDRFRFVVTRHEGGAAMMAAAHGKLTGRPGVAMVTRGPGATNASIGVHIASQDASPMLLFVGQVPTTKLGRRSFQEVDYRAMFGPLAKDVVQVELADRIPELVARAYGTATSGEPGPVVVALPEDVLMTSTSVPLAAPSPTPSFAVDDNDVARVVERLDRAHRPLVVVGGSRWTPDAVEWLRTFAEGGSLPVATATRNQDLIDNDSPVHVGTLGLRTTPGLPQLAAEADVVLLIGSRPDGLTTEDGDWLTAPQPDQALLHVHPSPDVLNSVYRADIALVADPPAFLETLVKRSVRTSADRDWLERLRANLKVAADTPAAGGDPEPFMAVLNERLSADAVVTAGAGAYTVWHQRFHRYVRFPSQLASQSGAMGYGLPAAIAAKLADPRREVVAFAGDGCFAMTGQELSTAARYGLDITVVVVNNEVYGTIRGHQQRAFPGRPSGTDLDNPDFAALARAHGAYGATASTPAEFADALDGRPSDGRTPSLIEVRFPYT